MKKVINLLKYIKGGVMKSKILISLSVALLFIACGDKPKTQAVSSESKDTIAIESLPEKNMESTDSMESTDTVFDIEYVTKIELSESKVIFSTDDLEKINYLVSVDYSGSVPEPIPLMSDTAKYKLNISKDEMPLNRIRSNGDTIGYSYNVTKLPAYKNHTILLVSDDNYDIPIYNISLLQNGNIYDGKSLDVTPDYDWGQPDVDPRGQDYEKKYFKIYNDWTIEIDVEKKEKDIEVQKYTKYYRINDKGNFYEVRKQ
ncbi:MAG: hypothetical protein LBH25_07965 [Fibromonadaceae bacterium]|jgi:hypothetical protein|nr:hypothetical protein [Fibromonadaceae bacterium]